MMILVMILAFIIFAGVTLIEGAIIGGILYVIGLGFATHAVNYLWLWLAGTLIVLIKPNSKKEEDIEDLMKDIKDLFKKD